MYDITAIGELLIDFTCESIDAEGFPTLTAHPGGAPANFLAAAAGFGASTAFLGKVGNDTFGKLLAQALKNTGIETKGLLMSEDTFTTLAFVTLDKHGNREFSFSRKPGADTTLRADEIDFSIIDRSKALHFGTLSLTDEPSRSATYEAVRYARTRGKLITYDPNLRKPLWHNLDEAKAQMIWGLRQADVVKISDEEVDFLFGLSPAEGADHIMSFFDTKLVMVTCGAEGCFYQNPVASGHVESLHGIQPIDTTGAGDIFGGSALWKIQQIGKRPDELENSDLREILRFACVSAGLSTTRQGGISSVPMLYEVLKMIEKEP